ncbi:alpha/beta hydrolase family protein [Kaistella palustris]|uniref:alpha/beta hydrolase family protein n=1 Tax=Kaistella palustris TaxID=493376 RepID=UPI00041A20D3|nr:hypothetical protein [Kaistella palustris]
MVIVHVAAGSLAISKSNELSRSWNSKPDNYGFLGEIAGGHLALLYNHYHPEEIEKLISLSGPTYFSSEKYQKSPCFKRTYGITRKIVGNTFDNNPAAFKQANPITHFSQIPTLLFQRHRGFLVNKKQGPALEFALMAKKIPHKLIFMKNSGHVTRFVKRNREQIIFLNILSFIQKKY